MQVSVLVRKRCQGSTMILNFRRVRQLVYFETRATRGTRWASTGEKSGQKLHLNATDCFRALVCSTLVISNPVYVW